jgi:REase_DpnII-MboI
MRVCELKKHLEEFRKGLLEHRELWRKSLDRTLREFPVCNHDALRVQTDALLYQLGLLRPFMEELHASWILQKPMTGVALNILDSAIGSHNPALSKGPSLSHLIDAVQMILGRLEGFADDNEFRVGEFASVNSDVELIVKLCSRLKQAARALGDRQHKKPGFDITDEYDIQDLVHALLRAYFKYPVRENPLPKVAGAVSTRADLCIEQLGVIIELKHVKSPTDQGRIEKDIAEDLVFYSSWTSLRTLIFVIYNSEDLQNADLLDKFSKPQNINGKEFQVKVILT